MDGPIHQAKDPATPTRERSVTSYWARRRYAPGVVYPPQVPNVAGTIDIHCHAHPGQQDALALSKLASQSGMRGLLFKTIVGRPDGAGAVRALRQELERWCEAEGLTPATLWAGCSVVKDHKLSLDHVREQLKDEVVAGVWMPNVTHADTLHLTGGKPIMWDPTADPKDHTRPLPWDEALKFGHYLLDEKGRLLPVARDIIHLVHDSGRALFFGHATHPEIWAMAEEVQKIGMKRAVIDHPFSPFLDLSVEDMQRAASAGIFLNFTYDELSPLLGVDPQVMFDAIRAIGVRHCTLSSDAGEPLFPHTVECMRLMHAYMEAFGLDKDELRQVTCTNPAFIVGLE